MHFLLSSRSSVGVDTIATGLPRPFPPQPSGRSAKPIAAIRITNFMRSLSADAGPTMDVAKTRILR
jgi:hypothetical protein